ncbi:MAG: agmatine deiminase family protein [Gammaproteobacteria bacterium]|nr:MAG: agmatine deiminase family protein [Gammaproteobacteria bacterium]
MYKLPPEWHPQSAVQLTWPHINTDWAPWLDQVEPVYIELTEIISQVENVLIVCHDESIREHVRQRLTHSKARQDRLRLMIAPCNDTWARDHGPITVCDDGTCKLMDFQFTGWGGKFTANLDNAITGNLYRGAAFTADTTHEEVDFILEGGGIEVNEDGDLLTTTLCLLNKNRNASYTKPEIEALLQKKLGIKRILWLEHGELEGDDTDSHIDTLARFLPDGQIAYVRCEDESDEHYATLKAMEAELQALRQQNGQSFPLVALPMASACFSAEGDRLPATYANFLLINNQQLLLPVYGVKEDEQAIRVLEQALPDYTIIPVNCRPLIEQYGSLHCITMQIPAGVVA